MKRLILLLALLIAFTADVHATPVVVSATQQNNFNPSGLGSDVTGISVSATNGSTTVTSSSLFRAAWVGLGGFRVLIAGVTYTVASVQSTSALSLTTAYAGTTGSATMTVYKYVEVRFYSNISFRPLGANEIIQVGTPGTSAWFKRIAAGVSPIMSGNVNTSGTTVTSASGDYFSFVMVGKTITINSVNYTVSSVQSATSLTLSASAGSQSNVLFTSNVATSILFIPQFVFESTTDSADNNQARYTIGFYRTDNSLIQYFTCSGAIQLRVPPTTPTSLPDLCFFNSNAVVNVDNDAYSKAAIDARFPSCPAGQLVYFAATGNIQTCLAVGSGLSISGGTISSSGSGGSCPDAPNQSVQYNNNGVCGGEPEFLYQISSADGGNLVRLTHATQETNLRLERTDASTIASIQLNSLGNAKFRRFETASPAFIELASGRTGPAFPNSLDALGRVDFIGSNAVSFNPSARIQAVAAENQLSTNLGTGLEISTTQNASSTLTKQVLINFLGTVNIRPGSSTVVSTNLGSNSALVVGSPNTINSDAVVQFAPASASNDLKVLIAQGNAAQAKAIFEVQNSAGTILYSIGAAGSHTYGGLSTAPPVSPADQGRIYFDLVLDKFQCSENGGVYVNCVGGGGSSPPFVDTTSIVEGSADATKEIRFEVDGLTTA
ncbi:MAG: hypothetical protein L0Y58_22430, partial [Verrucomicrobia subdivision 3 bacterium]|nr:hypothetical protein [Limisphaerales bacterium]